MWGIAFSVFWLKTILLLRPKASQDDMKRTMSSMEVDRGGKPSKRTDETKTTTTVTTKKQRTRSNCDTIKICELFNYLKIIFDKILKRTFPLQEAHKMFDNSSLAFLPPPSLTFTHHFTSLGMYSSSLCPMYLGMTNDHGHLPLHHVCCPHYHYPLSVHLPSYP